VAWYDEWAALIPILETMQMAECQRCRSIQADFKADLDLLEREHRVDEIGWCHEIANYNRAIREQATKITELERQLATAQMQAQQQQQQLDAMREQLQAANRAQCNADYMKGY